MTTTTVTSKDGTKIAYETVGTGPALVLIDGAMCHRSFGPARSLAEALKESFTVYLYDRRGRGESNDTLPYSADREVEDITAVMQSVNEPWFAFGMSSGGALALDAAIGGLPIAKVAIYEPPFFPPDDLYTKELASLLAADNNGDAAALFMTKVGMPPQAIDGMRNSPAWPMFEAIAPTLAYDNAILEQWFPMSDRASSVTTEVLVMDGSASPDFYRNIVKSAANELPNAKYTTLEGQTHEVDPALLASSLAAFF